MDSFWHVVARTVASEFSDLPDVEQTTRLVLRLLLSAVLGGLLGLERELHGKAAGVRTHMLVSLGAALFVLVPQQAGMDPADLSRVIQGVVAGVGFLCAGTILKIGDGHSTVSDEHVKGLTTAAGLWLTAAIGIASGLGREMTAVLTTLLAIGILSLEARSAGCCRAASTATGTRTPEPHQSARFFASIAAAPPLAWAVHRRTPCSRSISATRTIRPGRCGPGC